MKRWKLDGQLIYGIAPLVEYQAALNFAARCEGEEQRMILVLGESGAGKTVGARIFYRDCERHPLYLRVPSRNLLSPRRVLEMIADPLGVSTEMHTRYDLAREIIEDSQRRPRILLLDEAQSLAKHDMMDAIRWIHDEGAHTFVLIGTPALQRIFLDHREFAGRVALRHFLRLPTPEEITPLFEGVPPEAIEQVHRETGGRMRQVMSLRRRLWELIEGGKLETEALTVGQVNAVSKHFVMKVE